MINNDASPSTVAETDPTPVSETFAQWLSREMPAGTVIGDPNWWADKIQRRACLPMEPAEVEYLFNNPHALALLKDYHDIQQDQADSMGAGCSGNGNRSKQLREHAQSILIKDLDVWSDEVRKDFGFSPYTPPSLQAADDKLAAAPASPCVVYASCTNGLGSGGLVTVSFATLKEAQDFHQRVVNRAAPVAASLPTWDDPQVQAVYALLCADAEPPKGEHWEGFMARQIVAALREPSASDASGDSLEDNVRYLLDQCPHTIRDMSGDRTGKRGMEDLAGSLAITFLKMQRAVPPPYVPPPPIPTFQEQLDRCALKYPGVAALVGASGQQLVTIPNFPLPAGVYDRDACTVYFVVPAGWPYDHPKHFWTDKLRFSTGGLPYFTNDSNTIPGFPEVKGTTWWGWSVQSWNPRQDSLKTYVSVIKSRLFRDPSTTPDKYSRYD